MAKVTFISATEQREIEVSLKDSPFDDHGKPASLLALAMREGFFIDHACGGVCACSTCHVIVDQGLEHLSAATEKEEDMLDNAPGLTMRSRLSCQAEILKEDAVIVARIPSVNRNMVSEHA